MNDGLRILAVPSRVVVLASDQRLEQIVSCTVRWRCC